MEIHKEKQVLSEVICKIVLLLLPSTLVILGNVVFCIFPYILSVYMDYPSPKLGLLLLTFVPRGGTVCYSSASMSIFGTFVVMWSTSEIRLPQSLSTCTEQKILSTTHSHYHKL